MILFKFNFGLSSLFTTIIFLPFLFAAPVSVHLNQKLCSFKAGDYSLQWAFEPQSKNVVFVLKQKSDLNNFWTGVGFGDRKKGFIDFIGVFVKNGQIGIADTHIIPEDGTLTPDPSTNVQSIAFDYHNKSVTAKFARALQSPDNKFDQNLDNCQIFNFAINGGSISRSGIVPDFDEIVEKRICDIDKNCIVDIRPHLKSATTSESAAALEGNNKKSKNNNSNLIFSDQKGDIEDGLASMVMYWVLYSPSLDISSSSATKTLGNKKITKPEFAESVDISGTGDPCSFAGNGYTVNWTYSPETDMVDFSMKHPIQMGKRWSALGIGDTMADMDVAIMFISSGRPKRIRDYFSKSYGVPEEDKQQDWILSRHRTKSIDEMIELGFSRKLETNDNDKDRSLDGCVLFQFAANAGHYGSNFAVRKHEEWPDLYKACDIKKHCIKKSDSKEEEEDSEKNDKEEISESNDNDDIIDEADDVIVDEVILVKKRTEGKTKEESRRQLETSQIENDDGTSTTNLIIPLSGATFSTLVPSENEGEGTTTASEGNDAVIESTAATASEETTSNNQQEVTTASSPSTEKVEEGITTAVASGSSDSQQEVTTATDTVPESDQAVNNAVTDASNIVAENINSTPLLSTSEEAGAANNGEVIPTTVVSPENGAANNEVGITTTPSASESTAPNSTGEIETTTPGANVTQQPVHIIPMIGGELNSTMYIPGSENDRLRTAPEDMEANNSLEGAQSGNNGIVGGEGATNPTTSEPAFGIQSTVRERPTTISSEESETNAEEVTTQAPGFGGEENAESKNAVTGDALSQPTSETSEENESTGSQTIPSVTVPFNNVKAVTVSSILGLGEGVETTDSDIAVTTDGGQSLGENQIETITVPSEVKESIAKAGEELTNFANALNNTEIKVGVKVNATTLAATNSESEASAEGEITTPGTVEIIPEENGAEAEPTPSEVEVSLNAGLDSTTSEGTNEEESTTTASSNESVTEGSGKKGNKGGKGGKGKNNKGKGKNSDSTISPIGIGEDEAVTVSSDVTTASGEVDNLQETTIADDSDLTLKQTSVTESTTVATTESGETTLSENGTGITTNNLNTNSEIVATSVSSIIRSTNPTSKNIETTTTTTIIDSDANGSTIAIGMLPEVNATEEIQATVATGINSATTKSIQLVTGGDSNEPGDTTENLHEILSSSTTVKISGQGLKDFAVTETPSSSVATNKVTLPPLNSPTETTQTLKDLSPKPEGLSPSEVEGSGEVFPTSSSASLSSSEAPTTPIPGPFDHHKQQLIDELGKDAVGNPKEGCGESHEDYSQCTVYFKNYLARVQIWATENHERMEDQYVKACTLLSQVQNVTTLCCSLFVETCKGKIEF